MTENQSATVDDCKEEEQQADPPEETKDSSPSSGFQAFQLKPDLLKAIEDCGFELPSKVQHECIPHALRGTEILCHAKPGMGKTAIFVLATLQRLNPVENEVSVLVLCHSRELAFNISREYERFSKYMTSVRVATFCCGRAIDYDGKLLESNCPHIVVGTPIRILNLLKKRMIKLNNITHFVLDECDKLLKPEEMQRDVYEIFRRSSRTKQVMMFTTVLNKVVHPAWRRFMQNPVKIHGDDFDKSTLHILWQYYVKLKNDQEKPHTLFQLLDLLEFNKVVIYVRSVPRCIELAELLVEHNFPAIAIHRAMPHAERLSRYWKYKDSPKGILVATNFFGRGMYFSRVNIVFNYDTPEDSDTYLNRMSRAGQFGVKRLVISFLSDQAGAKTLNDVQYRYDSVIAQLPEDVAELPKEIEISPNIER